MTLSGRVYVAGHTGLVGSAVCRRLTQMEGVEALTVGRSDVDLRDFAQVLEWMREALPEYVIVAAGTVGGISANSSRPAEFLRDNLSIAANLIHGSHLVGVRRLLYLSSNCVYPRDSQPPHAIEMLGSGPMEPTNEWYGLAKISGMKLCDAYRAQYGSEFISLIPTSTFGPGDSLELGNGHLISDLLMKTLAEKRRMIETETIRGSVELWGSGFPVREYLYVDDLADAIVFALQHPETPPILNIGGGTRFTIRDLAMKIVEAIDERITLSFDVSRPDGAPARFLDNSVLDEMGWTPKFSFDEALQKTIDWYGTRV